MSSPAPETPYIAVDRVILARNISQAASAASVSGIALRPHVKTHKCIEIARMQLAAGAIGITVATVGEAEVFVDAGFTDVLIAYPVWLTEKKAKRLLKMLPKATIRMGVDSVDAGQRLASFLGVSATEVKLVIEVDCGHHRSGVEPDKVGQVARGLMDLGLSVTGVFTFPGHSYAPDARAKAAMDESVALAAAKQQLLDAGITGDLIASGGSTPSFSQADTTVVSEQRPGVYVFNDAQQLELESCGWDDVALTVRATVVSARGHRVIVDAGSKALGADKAPYATGYGRVLGFPDARIVALSEHHATIEFPENTSLPALGAEVSVVPNHVCNTVNLNEDFFVYEGSELVDCWKIAARGRNH